MIGRLRLAGVFALSGLLILVLLPFQLLGLWLFPRMAQVIPVVFHRCLLRLFGVKVHLAGGLPKQRPLLIVANHVSWLDIVVLGSIAPLSFVAKQEMASWPVFGILAKWQRTIFVRREDRRGSGQQANEIAMRLTAHEIIVLFPEATTTDGNSVWPFKTALFEAAKLALLESPVETALVQPVGLRYARLHGLPIGRAERPHVAWPGDLGLGESLVPLVITGALDVSVRIGEPIELTETSNRKVVAAEAHDTLRDLLTGVELNTGSVLDSNPAKG